jgi:hypothetical protein
VLSGAVSLSACSNIYRLESGYNDIVLYDTSYIASDIL